MRLLVELGLNGKWMQIGMLAAGDPEGSLSNLASGRRELVMFRCEGTHSVVSRSKGGVDREVGPLRAIRSLGIEEIARLERGEVYETPIQTDRMSRPAMLRLTHQR